MPVQRNFSVAVFMVNPNRPIGELPSRETINDVFVGSTSLKSYWKKVSNNNIVISNPTIFGWLNLQGAEKDRYLSLTGEPGPQQRVAEAIRLFASQIGTATFDGYILIDGDNTVGGGGGQASGNRIYSTLGGFNIGVIAHEMGHWLGLQHSAGDKNGTGYDDKWDLMSVNNVYFNQPVGLSHYYMTAPWLCALFLNHLDWATSAYKKNINQITGDETIVLRPLSTTTNQAGTFRMAIIEMDNMPDGIKYSIEFRIKQGFDGGIPGPAVLIHKWQSDDSHLIFNRPPIYFAYRMSNDPSFAHDLDNNKVRQWYKGQVFIDAQYNLRIEILEDGTTTNGRAIVKIGGTKALAGDLYWYHHNSRKIGEPNEWKGRELVSREERWDNYQHVFSGGEGVMYAITQTGNLKWRMHLGWTNGKQRWTPWIQIGDGGWNVFERIFSGGNGVIYGIKNDGKLIWFRHPGWLTGARDVIGGNEIGGGWGSFGGQKFTFSGGHGLIYSIIPTLDTSRAGHYDLLVYRHEDWINGSSVWADYSHVDAKGYSLVGMGGWDKIRVNGVYKNYKNFFADENGSIYAITEDGQLWWWHHNRRFFGEPITDGPKMIGNGGWEKNKFIFSGNNGVIYFIHLGT